MNGSRLPISSTAIPPAFMDNKWPSRSNTLMQSGLPSMRRLWNDSSGPSVDIDWYHPRNTGRDGDQMETDSLREILAWSSSADGERLANVESEFRVAKDVAGSPLADSAR